MNLPDSAVFSLFALFYILCSPGQLCWRVLFRHVGPVRGVLGLCPAERPVVGGQRQKQKWQLESWCPVRHKRSRQGRGQGRSKPCKTPVSCEVPSPTSGCAECRGWDVCLKAIDFCLLLPFTHSAEAVLDKIGSVMSLVEWRWRQREKWKGVTSKSELGERYLRVLELVRP